MSGTTGDGGVAKMVTALDKSVKSLVANLDTLAGDASDLEGGGAGDVDTKTLQAVDKARKAVLQDVRLILADVSKADAALAKLKPAK